MDNNRSHGPAARSSPDLFLEPVPHEMNDGRDVIDLAMLRAAVGAFEYPEGFVLGPDGPKKGARVLFREFADRRSRGRAERGTSYSGPRRQAGMTCPPHIGPC
mgnify:CR=1 FL=1